MDQPVLSADGRHIFALGSNEHTEYVRYDPRAREYQSLLGGANAAWRHVSSDGLWVVYCAENALWRSRIDGSERYQLASEWFNPRTPDLSQDGRAVVFAGTPQTGGVSRIYRVSTDGGGPRELIHEKYPTDAPYWSPDGSSIVYSVPMEAGTVAGLYVFDEKTENKRKIPGSTGFWKVSWSPDGRFLAAVHEDDHTMALFERSSQQWTDLAQGEVLSPPVWSSDSHYIYFQDVLEQDEPIRRLRVDTLTEERIVDCRTLLEGGVQRCGFEELTPDGALLIRLTRGDHDVYSLELVQR
jgi:Tol biopolymer transport system component